MFDEEPLEYTFETLMGKIWCSDLGSVQKLLGKRDKKGVPVIDINGVYQDLLTPLSEAIRQYAKKGTKEAENIFLALLNVFDFSGNPVCDLNQKRRTYSLGRYNEEGILTDLFHIKDVKPHVKRRILAHLLGARDRKGNLRLDVKSAEEGTSVPLLSRAARSHNYWFLKALLDLRNADGSYALDIKKHSFLEPLTTLGWALRDPKCPQEILDVIYMHGGATGEELKLIDDTEVWERIHAQALEKLDSGQDDYEQKKQELEQKIKEQQSKRECLKKELKDILDTRRAAAMKRMKKYLSEHAWGEERERAQAAADLRAAELAQKKAQWEAERKRYATAAAWAPAEEAETVWEKVATRIWGRNRLKDAEKRRKIANDEIELTDEADKGEAAQESLKAETQPEQAFAENPQNVHNQTVVKGIQKAVEALKVRYAGKLNVSKSLSEIEAAINALPKGPEKDETMACYEGICAEKQVHPQSDDTTVGFLLALVWQGVNDKNAVSEEEPLTDWDIHFRKETLLKNLQRAQREYLVEGKFTASCFEGIFGSILEVLDRLHPDVELPQGKKSLFYMVSDTQIPRVIRDELGKLPFRIQRKILLHWDDIEINEAVAFFWNVAALAILDCLEEEFPEISVVKRRSFADATQYAKRPVMHVGLHRLTREIDALEERDEQILPLIQALKECAEHAYDVSEQSFEDEHQILLRKHRTVACLQENRALFPELLDKEIPGREAALAALQARLHQMIFEKGASQEDVQALLESFRSLDRRVQLIHQVREDEDTVCQSLLEALKQRAHAAYGVEASVASLDEAYRVISKPFEVIAFLAENRDLFPELLDKEIPGREAALAALQARLHQMVFDVSKPRKESKKVARALLESFQRLDALIQTIEPLQGGDNAFLGSLLRALKQRAHAAYGVEASVASLDEAYRVISKPFEVIAFLAENRDLLPEGGCGNDKRRAASYKLEDSLHRMIFEEGKSQEDVQALLESYNQLDKKIQAIWDLREDNFVSFQNCLLEDLQQYASKAYEVNVLSVESLNKSYEALSEQHTYVMGLIEGLRDAFSAVTEDTGNERMPILDLFYLQLRRMVFEEKASEEDVRALLESFQQLDAFAKRVSQTRGACQDKKGKNKILSGMIETQLTGAVKAAYEALKEKSPAECLVQLKERVGQTQAEVFRVHHAQGALGLFGSWKAGNDLIETFQAGLDERPPVCKATDTAMVFRFLFELLYQVFQTIVGAFKSSQEVRPSVPGPSMTG